jgi:hypothetical protein
MKTLLLTVLTAGLLAAGDAPDDAKKEKEKLQGIWKAFSIERNGQKKDEAEEHTLSRIGCHFGHQFLPSYIHRPEENVTEE